MPTLKEFVAEPAKYLKGLHKNGGDLEIVRGDKTYVLTCKEKSEDCGEDVVKYGDTNMGSGGTFFRKAPPPPTKERMDGIFRQPSPPKPTASPLKSPVATGRPTLSSSKPTMGGGLGGKPPKKM